MSPEEIIQKIKETEVAVSGLQKKKQAYDFDMDSDNLGKLRVKITYELGYGEFANRLVPYKFYIQLTDTNYWSIRKAYIVFEKYVGKFPSIQAKDYEYILSVMKHYAQTNIVNINNQSLTMQYLATFVPICRSTLAWLTKLVPNGINLTNYRARIDLIVKSIEALSEKNDLFYIPLSLAVTEMKNIIRDFLDETIAVDNGGDLTQESLESNIAELSQEVTGFLFRVLDEHGVSETYKKVILQFGSGR